MLFCGGFPAVDVTHCIMSSVTSRLCLRLLAVWVLAGRETLASATAASEEQTVQVPCGDDATSFKCKCYGHVGTSGNSSVFSKVQCDATGVNLDDLMGVAPRAELILLFCIYDATNYSLTNATLFRHVTSLKHFQILSCRIQDVASDTFSLAKSLQKVDLFYSSLKPENLPAFGEITNSFGYDVTLYLSTNELSSLPESAFGTERLKNITSLSVGFNAMTEVAPRAFSGMSRLKRLFLNNNAIGVIRNATFAGCSELEKLDLSRNRITLMEEGALSPLTSLRVLNLPWNRLVHLDAGLFWGLSELRYLNLSHNFLTNLPDGIFDGLTSLHELRLDFNSLVVLQAEIVAPSLADLTVLNVSHNSLRDVTPFLLQTKIQNLKTIDFSFNDLRKLRRGAVTGLLSLETLDFRNNSLSMLEWESIGQTPKLLSVNLRDNNFRSVPQDLITYFIVDFFQRGEQMAIFLSGNPFSCGCHWALVVRFGHENWYPVVLVDIDEFQCAAPPPVQGRQLMKLSEEEFWCPLENCVEGCACYNQTIDKTPVIICQKSGEVSNLRQLPVTTVIFECLSCLEEGILTMPVDGFSGLDHLEILKITGNNLVSILPGTFSDLSRLRILSLENNKFSQIPSGELEELSSLREVNLHGNRLSQVSYDLFASCSTLESVDLSGNDLATLPDGLFNLTSGLESVRLHGNPLVCNCSLLWLKQWMQANFRIVEDIQGVQCTVNETDVWIPVIQVADFDFGCRNDSDHVITKVVVKVNIAVPVILCCVGVLFLLAAVIGVRYRYYIRVLLYARFGFYFVHRGDNDTEDEFEYDAYLAYSDVNIKEALHEVAPRLERHAPPYVLCLRHRDFPVGGSLATTIVESINASKRTVLFMSRSFLENEWCLLEFQAAHAQTLRDKINRVILVFVEDVTNELLDEDLKLYMSVTRCLPMKRSQGRHRSDDVQLLDNNANI